MLILPSSCCQHSPDEKTQKQLTLRPGSRVNRARLRDMHPQEDWKVPFRMAWMVV